ncbi:hypothetical protein PLEOSDRAFT_1090694, partial [Pleurotus ostreatus PC15]
PRTRSHGLCDDGLSRTGFRGMPYWRRDSRDIIAVVYSRVRVPWCSSHRHRHRHRGRGGVTRIREH